MLKVVVTVLVHRQQSTALIQLVLDLILSKGEQAKPVVYRMDSREVNPYLCGALDEAISLP